MNLHLHLESCHEEEYVRVCTENDWPMQLAKRKRREMECRKASSSMQSTLDGVALPGQCVHLFCQIITNTTFTGVVNRVAFSQLAFMRHLVNFIVADDQVCLF
jgi:hypothetical protein